MLPFYLFVLFSLSQLCTSLPVITKGSKNLSVLFNGKDSQRDEQWKLQQEILARRKNKSKMKEYFENVEKKRFEATKEAASTKWANTKDAEDPLNNWRKAKVDGT